MLNDKEVTNGGKHAGSSIGISSFVHLGQILQVDGRLLPMIKRFMTSSGREQLHEIKGKYTFGYR